MKPTFRVLILANECAWASWPTKIAWLQAFFASIATIEIDLKQVSFEVPFVNFTPTNTQYEVLRGQVSYVNPAWYKANITPLAAGYDISLLVCALGQWPVLDCVRGVTTLGTPGPIPCQIGANENDAVYNSSGVMLFQTAEHYAAHELCHALFQLAGQTPADDTTHFWDFYEQNLVGTLTDILFTSMIEPSNPEIVAWANAIQTREGGAPTDANMVNNNPGNIKATKYGLSLGATKGITPDHFCIYETYEIGFNALCQLLCDAANGELIGLKPSMTILAFTAVYAEPPNDNYADAVAAALGVPVTTTISQLFA